MNTNSQLNGSKWLFFLARKLVLVVTLVTAVAASPSRANADIVGAIGGVIRGSGDLIGCRNDCEDARDQCLQNVMDAFAAAHAACQVISQDPGYPYGDSYYSCMTALGFGDPLNPTDPLGPLASVSQQREQCRDNCESCKAACNRRFGGQVIRGIVGVGAR